MTYLKVNYDNDIESSYREDREYGDWSSNRSHSIHGIDIVEDGQSYDLVRHDEVKDGDILYLVVVQYSSGDSFGIGKGYITFVDTFRSLENAKKCLEAVKNSEDEYEKGNNFEYIMDNGEKYSTGYAQWLGYFESLEDCYILKLVVGEDSGKIR